MVTTISQAEHVLAGMWQDAEENGNWFDVYEACVDTSEKMANQYLFRLHDLHFDAGMQALARFMLETETRISA